jgi:hypothetical protein
LYIYSGNSNDPKSRSCSLSVVKFYTLFTEEAKKQHYNRLISKSANKIKTTQDIMKKGNRTKTSD